MENGQLISFASTERPLELGPDFESGWIKIGDGQLKMMLPNTGGPGTHMLRQSAQTHWQQPTQMAYQYYQMPPPPPPDMIVLPRQSSSKARDEDDELHDNEQDVVLNMKEAKANKRNYPCTDCSKTFSTSGHLARHRRLHTGDKPHECPYNNCDKKFSRQGMSLGL